MSYSRYLMCFLTLLVAACTASPSPQYYTLSSAPGMVHAGGGKLTVKVRRPVIPVTLDRPEMVSQSGDFKVTQDDNRLWSEPLDTMIERVLAEDIRLRLPRSMIVTESSEVPVKDAHVLDIDIQQFGTDASGNAVLQAQAVIRRPDGKERSLPLTLHGGHVTSAESMARNLSDLVGSFADSVAGAL